MWLFRHGHVTAHTPLFVTALVAVWIETGWVMGAWDLLSLLGSGNHAHAENHMQAFWEGLVERHDPTVMGSRGEGDPTLEGREGPHANKDGSRSLSKLGIRVGEATEHRLS